MNYFRCTVGGSGKGNTVTVTCAEEFAGLTITLSKTGKTYTKTCPSTAPYVVTFNGVENGTYTVSCTVDGQTYSETVVVQDISCVLNYGFKWQTWVDTASQLDSTDYASLSEVLADEKALRELFLEHACVDYMASVGASNEDLETIINNDYCAKWINLSDYALDYLYANEVIADLMDEADKYFYGEWVITDSTTTPPTWGPKGNVPVMTYYNKPYGMSNASASASGYDSNRVFDGNEATEWTSGKSTYPQHIQYKFVNPTCVKKFKVRFTSYVNSTTYVIQGSNDDSTYTDISESITDTNKINEHNINNNNYYLYYRLKITAQTRTGGASIGQIYSLQFYGRELKVSVPTMTSNTAPYGNAICTENVTNFDAYKAFDNSDSTDWRKSSSLAYIGYEFTNDVLVKMVYAKAASNYTETICYGDDKTETEFAITTSTNGAVLDMSANTILAKKWWLKASGSGSFNHYAIQFYGLDYSEKEFEVGTTKKWLYDHGVELVELDKLVGSNGGTIADNGHEFVMSGGTTDGFNNFGQVCTKNKIDVTNYSWLFAKYGDEILGTTTSGYVGEHGGIIVDTVKPNGTYSDETTVAIFSKNTPLTSLQFGGSVSAINSEYYIRFGTGYWKSIKSSYTEAWLE